MSNKVFLNKDKIIEIVYQGNQTKDTAVEYLNKVSEIIDELKKENKSVLVLGNLEDIGESSSESRALTARALRELDYNKVAIYGGNTYIRQLANFIFMASGKAEKCKLFDARQQALDWLLT